MKTVQILLFALTAMAGCSKANTGNITNTVKSGDTTAKAPVLPDSTAFTYLALSDSYTIGQSVPLQQSFPYQLTASLKSADNINVNDPTIIATTGWTTDDLIEGVANSSINNKTYDIVTLLIGVNDQYQGLSQANYRAKFAQVLQTAIKFVKGDVSRVFVLSIPDYGVTPFAGGQDAVIGPQIDQFNTINQEETLKAVVQYVNITPASKLAANDASLIAPDGLHPSAKMYALWVQQLEPLVAKRLKK